MAGDRGAPGGSAAENPRTGLMQKVALALAGITGVVILLAYFLPPLRDLQSVLLNWVLILAGSATMVGVFNLVLVHGSRIQNRERGTAHSAVLLISLLAAFVLGLLLGPAHPVMRHLIDAVVVPAEASLMALLAASLLYGAVRLLGRRANLMSAVFLRTAVLMLVSSATLPGGEVAGLNHVIRPWFQHVLALGGVRGLLIGVALGTLTTGLRVLLGTDRPYEGG
jgi:hypothetical protein